MLFYSYFLLVLSILNIILCSGFNVYYYIKPIDFAIGTNINYIANLIGSFEFFIMILLGSIYYLILRETSDSLKTFNKWIKPLYILLMINAFYLLIFGRRLDINESLSPVKVVAQLALASPLNLTIASMASNYIKQNKKH